MRLRSVLAFLLSTAVIVSVVGWMRLREEPWCPSERALDLRRRSYSTTAIRTVDALLDRSLGDEIAIFAHRGGIACEELDRAPENSLANVEKAVRMGFTGFETDLWRTRDGAYLIHHDNYVGRTTSPAFEPSTPPRTVESSTFEEMRALRLKYPSGKVSSEQVPTLREFIDAGRGRILFLIELKGDAAAYFPEILKIVEDAEAKDHVLFWITWKRERAEALEKNLRAGLRKAQSHVVWRVGNLEEYEDITRRFAPRIIDLKPSWRELRWERFLGLTSQRHLSLVERAIDDGIIPMVSRLSTLSYLETLYEKGVRVFMSRSPERYLSQIIEVGLEPRFF